MADQTLPARIGPEGRVTIPAQLRRQMGLAPGDVVRFSYDAAAGDLRILSASQLVAQLWANNTGGDAINSTEVVRHERLRDQLLVTETEGRLAAEAREPFDEELETARLLETLGLE